MLGKAQLYCPAVSDNEPIHISCLSDELAMIFGRSFAWTLSEQDGYVQVTLESGEHKLIGHDTVKHKLVFGRLKGR
jgi:hypothetical protein